MSTNSIISIHFSGGSQWDRNLERQHDELFHSMTQHGSHSTASDPMCQRTVHTILLFEHCFAPTTCTVHAVLVKTYPWQRYVCVYVCLKDPTDPTSRRHYFVLNELRVDLPNTVEDVSIGKDSNVYIGHENIVKPSFLLVPEESIWHPHFTSIRHGEVFDLGCKRRIPFKNNQLVLRIWTTLDIPKWELPRFSPLFWPPSGHSMIGSREPTKYNHYESKLFPGCNSTWHNRKEEKTTEGGSLRSDGV